MKAAIVALVLLSLAVAAYGQRVIVPPANDPSSYVPQQGAKPLPPQPVPAEDPFPPLKAAFARAYDARRSPRIMVFVNRTIQGDSLDAEKLAALMKVSDGSYRISAYDEIGARAEDYEMIENSLLDYINGANMDVRDSSAVRAKMEREKVLRLENGDKSILGVLSQELQTDVLVQAKASPTMHASVGKAVRLQVRTYNTTDGRILATTFVDMPLPMTKTNISAYTKYLAAVTMQRLTAVWTGSFDPIEVRIHKLGAVDDGLLIRKFITKTTGVSKVLNRGSTGSGDSAYAVLSVSYNGAPEEFYEALQENLKLSKGLKATDLQNNTLTMELSGPLQLKVVRTTVAVETKREERVVEEITLSRSSSDGTKEESTTTTTTEKTGG